MILRKFNKKTSVFKPWKVDTHSSLRKAFELDINYSKMQKFLKDKETFEEVTDVLFRHTAKIKDIFTFGIGESSFPSIEWFYFVKMCNVWEIVDENLDIKTIDRIFIATNYEEVEQEDNPDRDLCRYEFYEILARLAKEKYFNKKI